MITRLIKISKVIFFLIIIFNTSQYTQQLALPNQILTTINGHNISYEAFSQRYNQYLVPSDLKNYTYSSNSILKKNISGNLLPDNVTLSIINLIETFNNKSPLTRELKSRKVFCFN